MFEGYVGIRMWDGQGVDDIVFGLLFLLFVTFAIVFHVHYRLFEKMLRDVFHLKERSNMSAVARGSEWFFRNFMNVQALMLCGICLFVLMRAQGYFGSLKESDCLWAIGLVFGILTGYYWCKRCCYYLIGLVFTDPEHYRFWRTSYNALIGLWGVTLYIPTLWLVFVNASLRIPVLLILSLYVLSRFVIINRTVRIFHKKNSSLLYISLYLCGLEILPLFFMYKAVVYWYNYFGSSTLWH